MTIDKAPDFADQVKSVVADDALVVQYTSADHKLATGFYEFAVFTVADWAAKLGRGMDTIDFTVPRAFLDQRPGVFQALFAAFCEAPPTVSGHAGFGVNVPPMGRSPNEASEYYFAPALRTRNRRGRPDGHEHGRPGRENQDGGLARCARRRPRARRRRGVVAHAPPDWYVRQPLNGDGLIVQAGATPLSGMSAGPGKPPLPPPAYVLLNAALRPIVAEKMDILQRGTPDSNAPMLNTTVATKVWLKRFDLPDDEVTSQWRELHKTPSVADGKPAITANLHRLRKAMGLPEAPPPSSGFGYETSTAG